MGTGFEPSPAVAKLYFGTLFAGRRMRGNPIVDPM